MNVGYHLNDMGMGVGFKDIEIQNTNAIKAYGQYPFDAANVSFHDLPVLAQYLKVENQKTAPVEMPFLKSLVSANLIPEADQKTHAPVQPYVIREVKTPRAPKGKFRVGIVGFSEPSPMQGTGYVWRDPEVAAREVLPKLRKQVDLVVVLAYMPLDKAKAFASQITDTDVVIAAYGQSYVSPIEKIGETNFLVSFFETKFLGELRIYLGPKGAIRYDNRFVVLDAQIPDDPNAAKLVAETRDAMDAARKAMMQGNQ